MTDKTEMTPPAAEANRLPMILDVPTIRRRIVKVMLDQGVKLRATDFLQRHLNAIATVVCSGSDPDRMRVRLEIFEMLVGRGLDTTQEAEVTEQIQILDAIIHGERIPTFKKDGGKK